MGCCSQPTNNITGINCKYTFDFVALYLGVAFIEKCRSRKKIESNEIESKPKSVFVSVFYSPVWPECRWYMNVCVRARWALFSVHKNARTHKHKKNISFVLWKINCVRNFFFLRMLHKTEHRTKVFDMQLITQSTEIMYRYSWLYWLLHSFIIIVVGWLFITCSPSNVRFFGWHIFQLELLQSFIFFHS